MTLILSFTGLWSTYKELIRHKKNKETTLIKVNFDQIL